MGNLSRLGTAGLCLVACLPSTAPRATVRIAGRRVRARPDGSFSVRMAFPGGEIVMPIEAVAGDGEQRRGLTMSVRRASSPGEGGAS